MNIHPSFDITETVSEKLKGKKIILCVTGSVAACRSPELARLLMRHGAEVFPVMTSAAKSLIHPDLMYWACGNKPITELTGAVEHVALAGNTSTKGDLILIAPCTANTIGKIAAGIDDTPVTTFVTTGMGEGIPLIVVPAMHAPMYNHPFVIQNLTKLEDAGVYVVKPRLSEGKAKIPENGEILESVFHVFEKNAAGMCDLNLQDLNLKGMKILVTAGRTVEYIDPIRVITNNSTGKMGVALAKEAYANGADVTLVAGKLSVAAPLGIKTIYAETGADMYNKVHEELSLGKYHVFASAAAVGDWQPEETSLEKISTHDKNSLTIKLKPVPKIIDTIRHKYQDIFIIAFRALHNLEEKELLENAKWRMEKACADMIAVNDVSKKDAGFESDTNEMFVITAQTSNGTDAESKVEKISMSSKNHVAFKILEIMNRVIDLKK